jgi:hypothetical protein
MAAGTKPQHYRSSRGNGLSPAAEDEPTRLSLRRELTTGMRNKASARDEEGTKVAARRGIGSEFRAPSPCQPTVSASDSNELKRSSDPVVMFLIMAALSGSAETSPSLQPGGPGVKSAVSQGRLAPVC